MTNWTAFSNAETMFSASNAAFLKGDGVLRPVAVCGAVGMAIFGP